MRTVQSLNGNQSCFKLRLLFAALMVALGCTAQARVVYVTPTGAGNMDGTSWENAYASVEVAYADVGLDAAGGTVCIAGGTYLVSAPMSMRPNVAVVGGFGGETILSGDKGSADTWKRNNAGTTSTCDIFDENGALVLPAPAAEDEFWAPYDPTYSSDRRHSRSASATPGRTPLPGTTTKKTATTSISRSPRRRFGVLQIRAQRNGITAARIWRIANSRRLPLTDGCGI